VELCEMSACLPAVFVIEFTQLEVALGLHKESLFHKHSPPALRGYRVGRTRVHGHSFQHHSRQDGIAASPGAFHMMTTLRLSLPPACPGNTNKGHCAGEAHSFR
jgi:hypothetical protein